MKKIIFAAFVLGLFAVSASAQVVATPVAINVKAIVPETASLIVTGTTVTFNVTDATVATTGDVNPTAGGVASMRKGHGATICVTPGPAIAGLIGVNDAKIIPITSVSVDAGVMGQFDQLGVAGNGNGCTDPLGVFISKTTVTSGVLNYHLSATPFALKLAAVPSATPDTYAGVINVTMQVM
jgi:hypothetical protein